jgi:hypothetical protein
MFIITILMYPEAIIFGKYAENNDVVEENTLVLPVTHRRVRINL